MKAQNLILTILLVPTLSFAGIQLDKSAMHIERGDDLLSIALPFQNEDGEPVMDDMTVTLLDENDQPLAKVEKKLALLGGKQEETVALPIAASTPPTEKCRIRVDFRGMIWLKQFNSIIQGQEIQIIGQNRWIAGSQPALRVIVANSSNGKPVENAEVQIRVFGGDLGKPVKTDADGNAFLPIRVPDSIAGQQNVTVTVQSPLGVNTIDSPIEVVPGTKIFLSTDKPVYQPNQIIHIRALAAHKTTGEPLAERKVLLEVFDGKGNKVFKQDPASSEFGIVSADFQLADEVNQGEYKIQATLNGEVSEKAVQVYEYVLPKFRVDIKTKEKFYAPGDEVTGSVESRYFFGKPLAGAKVTIVANCFDVGFNEFAKTETTTDAEGKADYKFAIPDRLVGQPEFKGNTIVQMDVRVRDTADHEEQKNHTFHVAIDPLQIEAIPESGNLVPGVENEIYLVASTPDGSVAQPELTVSSKFLEKPVTVKCDENGIASIHLIPQAPSIKDVTVSVQNVAPPKPEMPVLHITAESNGKKIDITKDLSLESSEANLLLRVNKGVYGVGQEMEITALSAAAPGESVFLDILKNNQTILTKTLRLKSGRATLSLPLDNQLSGSLTLNAYIIGPGGLMIRDTRQVVVLRSDDLRIEIAADQPEYQPGQPAQVKLTVATPKGEPVRAALGMNVVDESVYSLSEKEPGLAKVFFAIERELLQPKVEIHGDQLDKVVRLSAENYQKNANLSKALLAKLGTLSEYGLNIDTAKEKEQKANADLNQIRGFTQWQTLPALSQPMDVAEALLFLQQPINALPTIDPWGRPYRLVMDKESNDPEKGNLFLVCEGRDGKLGTGDDIRINNYNSPFIFSFIVSATDTLTDNRVKELLVSQGFGGKNIVNYKNIDTANSSIQYYFSQESPTNRRVKMSRAKKTAMGEDGGGVVELGMALAEEAAPPGMAGGAMPMAAPAERMAGIEVRGWAPNLKSEKPYDTTISSDYYANVYGGQLKFQESETDAFRSLPGVLPADLDLLTLADKKNGRTGVDAAATDLLAKLEANTDLRQSLGLDASATQKPVVPLVVNGKVDIEQLRQIMDKLPPSDEAFKDEREQIAQLIEQIGELSPAEKEKAKAAAAQNQKSVRVRRYFPETLFYTPETITDDNGLLALNLPMADSITTWRMSAMANAKNGAIGDATSALKVFKPFFIDLDLPVALIQNDEVTIPVAVYNYLSEPQEVKIALERAPWFNLLEGEFERTVSIAANEVSSVTYRIRAGKLGAQPITVFAWGSKDNDAIGKTIEVRPNGSPQFVTANGRLTGSVKETVNFPQGRVAGADKLFVKIYPGFFSQVVEGLDAILQMPNGCFEQTSSTTYPNILALQYMKQTGKITPAVEMKAKEYINLGYQRLLTFEIPGGGFQVFGSPPATRILSAYGLLEFTDMSQVYSIDANVIQRTQSWLMGQMKQDGSWDPDENYAHAEMWKSIQDNRVLATAYVAMALAQTGVKNPLEPAKAYLLNHAGEAKDAYTLAILCNALLALDRENPAAKTCMQRLVDLGIIEGDRMYWKSEASMSYARGDHANVEATAWVVMALLEDGRFSKETGKALNWIIDQKDPNGTWGTTHGTVLALKALVNSLGKQTQHCDATVLVRINGKDASRLEIKPDTSDLFRQLDLTQFASDANNDVEIDLEGEGSLLYQVVGKYFVPWTANEKERSQPFDIQVQYDRSQLRRNDTVTCQIKGTNQKSHRVEMVMIDIGIPPGFRVEQPTLDEYVNNKTIAKYSLTPRQMTIYLQSMDGGQTVELKVPMKATLPMVAKAPESTIYEYYNPEQKKASPPQDLEVK